MTFEQWCVMVYEMACDKYWKGKKRVCEIGYYTDMDDRRFNRLYEAVVQEHPRWRYVNK